MNKPIRMISCPNCGGTVSGSKCEYCGSIFWDIADMELNKPAFVRMRIQDKTFVCKAVPITIDLQISNPDIVYYADNEPFYYVASPPDYRMNIEFVLTTYGPDKKEHYRVVMDDAPERDKYLNNMED